MMHYFQTNISLDAMGNWHTSPFGYTDRIYCIHWNILDFLLGYPSGRILLPTRPWSVEPPWHFFILIWSLRATDHVDCLAKTICLSWPLAHTRIGKHLEPGTHFTVLLGTCKNYSSIRSARADLPSFLPSCTVDGWRQGSPLEPVQRDGSVRLVGLCCTTPTVTEQCLGATVKAWLLKSSSNLLPHSTSYFHLMGCC